jgi:subtilisin family serine protease
MSGNSRKPINSAGTIKQANGKPKNLIHHLTDFSVKGDIDTVKRLLPDNVKVQHLAIGLSRVISIGAEERDQFMTEVRRSTVAHHIYQVEDTSEEVVIADRIYLTMSNDNLDNLNKIIDTFKLKEAGQMGRTQVLEVTNETGINPVKAADQIAEFEGVESCLPKMLRHMPLRTIESSRVADLSVLKAKYKLFDQQWYLANNGSTLADVDPTAHINVHEAWRLANGFGNPNVVIGIIDDGFDLEQLGIEAHAIFKEKVIKDKVNFVEAGQSPLARPGDSHGTRVASVATASLKGDGMLGVAPGCALQLLRIGSGPHVNLELILEALRKVNGVADVVNCSFNTQPSSMTDVPPGFIEEVSEMARTGGRRGKGLIIVASAGNDDAPIYLPAQKNINGVSFVEETFSGKKLN